MRISDIARRNLDAFEATLGIPIGPLMIALVELHAREQGGFEGLELLLEPGFERIPEMTPVDVLPFGATAIDLTHFGFLITEDENRSTDSRPICLVTKDFPTAHVVAPDLAGFLSLAAVAGVQMIRRGAPDAAYFRAREERLAESGGFRVGEEFRRISDLLCTIPGVALPESPQRITLASPDLDFELEPRPTPASLPGAYELWRAGKERAARRVLLALVAKWLDHGDLVLPANWALLRTALAEMKPVLTDEQRAALEKRRAAP
jgi:hypothetical protein